MISIGTFSRLGHISVRMLRHYDAIGLLPPAHVDAETGYRYYAWQQLETLGRIEELKGYRFPLARIVELMRLDADALAQVMHEKRLALYKEMADTQRMLRRLDGQLGHMEEIEMAQQEYKVTVMECQPERIFGISKHINIGQVHELFEELHAEMAKRGLKKAGAGLFFYLGEEFSYEDMDVEAAFPVSGEHPDVREMPGGPYVATIHHGSYERVKGAYEAIGQYLDGHPEWEIAGPGLERYIRDETDGAAPEDFETGVLFPVRRV